MRRRGSRTAELWPALLFEGLQTLGRICRVQAVVGVPLPLQAECGVDARAFGPARVEHVLGVAYRKRAPGCDALRKLQPGGQQLAVVHNPVDDAPRGRLGRGEVAGREDELASSGGSDRSWQEGQDPAAPHLPEGE